MGTAGSASGTQPADSATPGFTRALSRRVAATAVITLLLVVVLGWTTDLRGFMQASLITVCVFALFPFLVIAGLLAVATLLLFAIALIGAAVDADLGTDIDIGIDLTWAVRPYYRWLARQRRLPLFGVPVGLLLGGLLLWAALAVFVLPSEATTTERLLQAQSVVENAYREAKRYPAPDDRGHFPVPDAVASSFANALGARHQLLDAFGRPVRYEVKGHWKLVSYRLRSLGFDGVRSDDDLCVGGQTGLQAMVDTVIALREVIGAVRLEDLSWTDQLQRIRAANCVDD